MNAPLKVGRFFIAIDVLVIVVVAGVLALGLKACGPADDVNIHLNNAHKLALKHIAQRDSIRKAIAASDKSATATGRQGERVSVAAQTVEVLLTDTLRVPVRDTALENASRALIIQVSIYQDSVHAERMARLNERMAWQSASQTQDSIVAAWQGAYEAEKGRRWRYRGEGAIAGLLLALTLVVAL